ncbi:MAG TPA: hypothetical protein VN833_15670 [Candidatus Acidoferrales bacterium]|nr:hypothetical protein [Candidatus Acidoferrales bacterium]
MGDDRDSAVDSQKRKQAYFEALDANVPVIQNQDETGRTKITAAVYQWFAELQLFQGKDQLGKSEKTLRAYNYLLGFFLDFTAPQNLRFLDQIDRTKLLRTCGFNPIGLPSPPFWMVLKSIMSHSVWIFRS